MLSRSFTHKELLKLNHSKHKQLCPQFPLEKPLEPHQSCSLFGPTWNCISFTKGRLSFYFSWLRNLSIVRRLNDKTENIITEPLDSLSFEAVQAFQRQKRKSINKNTKTLLQQSAILNYTDLTDNDDPFGKKPPNAEFSSDLSLNKNSSISQMDKKSEIESHNCKLFMKQTHL